MHSESPFHSVLFRPGAALAFVLALVGALSYGQSTLLAARGLTALPNPPLASTQILVDGSQTHQPMDGFGVGIDSSRWNGGELAPALDLLVDDLGATLFRVTVDGSAWEATNDNDDPNTFDWAYYSGASASPRAEALWSTLDYLNQKGVTSGIVLAMEGPVPAWMGGTRIDVSAEDEWVEMIASLVHYARVNRNLHFSRLSPLDEPDGNGRRGPRVDELQTVRLLRKLARRLDADGLGDVRLVAPRTAAARIAVERYIPHLLADRFLSSHLEAFALNGDAGFVGEAGALIGGSADPGRKLWLSERSPVDGAALDAVTRLLERLRDDAVTGAIFDGRDRPGDDSRLADQTSIGPLSYDPARHTYGPGKALAAIAQVGRFVGPGALRIGAASSSESLPVVAFFDPARRRVTVVGRNTSKGSRTVAGALAGLPLVTSLELYETDPMSADLQRAPDVSVSTGRFTARVSGNAVFTLTGTTNPTPAARAGGVSSARREPGLSPATAPPTIAITAGASGLVAAYGFEEGAGSAVADASGLGNAGTISGATWVTAGKYGKALSFNGTSSLVTVNDTATLHLTTALTLEAWVRPSASASWRSVLMKATSNGLAYGLYASNASSRPAGFIHIGADIDATGPTAIALNAWTHLAASYDGAALKLYVNGSQVTSRAVSGSVATSTSPLRLGGNTIWGEYFAGVIDEVRIYNRALSAAEVQADMNAPVSGGVDTVPPTVTLSAPSAGSTLSGTVTVSATAADDVGVAGVQFLLDGAVLGAEDATAPYSVSWNTATAANGAHSLTARARDGSGNQTTSAAVGVTVQGADPTAPTVSITAPAAGSTVSGTVTVSADASDNVGVAGVQFFLDGAALGAEDATAPFSVDWDTLSGTAGAAAAPAATANLTVDAGQSFQTMAGMGSNVNVNSWKGGQLQPALDALVDQGGESLLRVVRDPMDWVSAESDITLLHSLDAATLTRIYEAPKMQDIWSTIAYLNQKGLGGKQIILNFMGWTPPWLGGSGAYGSASHITAGKEPKFATMVASLVYYGRMVKGLDFTLLAPMNEPDLDGKEGPLVGAAQYVTVLKALITELDAMGLTDVRIVGPDTSGSPSSYISAMMADTTVRGRVDHLAFHVYGGSTSPGTAYSGKDYWLTEAAQWCSTCDQNGTPSQGEWAFARETNDFFLKDVANGFPAVLVWEAYDGFYYHHNSYSTWGLLAYNTATGVYTPRKRLYANAQLTAFIRPGAKRVSVSTSVTGLTALAFYDAAKGQVAIVGHNTGGSPAVINGQFSNLPVTVSALALYETNSGSQNLQRVADVAVSGQAFSVSIPADTFFSLRSTSAGADGPHTLTARARDAAGNQTTSAAVSVTVQNDGPVVSALSIADASTTEGDSGTKSLVFTATLSPASGSTVSVSYATANGTATAGSDYAAQTGTLSLTAGQTSKTISVVVNGDTTVEPDETLTVTLSGPAGATLSRAQATGTITNDDVAPLPTLSTNDVTVTEGNAGTIAAQFSVTLSAASSSTVTVSFATADGTATAGSDYVAQTGTLSFAAGQTSKTIALVVNGDTTVEPDETFLVNLSSPAGATLADAQGQATITNDDTVPPPPGSAPVVWASAVGVIVSGNSLTKTATTTWGNAGAISTQQLASGDGYVEITASETTTNRMFGLSNGNTDANYPDIDFGLNLRPGGVIQVYEGGVLRGTFGAYATGDKLRVAVEGGVVKYRMNGALLYTSLIAPTYPLVVDTALYTQNATITSAVISNRNEPVAWTSLVGVSATGNSLTKTAVGGWGTGGAISTQQLAGDGYVEITASETTTNRMFGLGNGNTNASYTDINFGIDLRPGAVLQIYENGTLRGTVGTYAPGDLLRVAVEGGVVKYRRNGALLYTSGVAPAYPLLVDTALYARNATITSAIVVFP